MTRRKVHKKTVGKIGPLTKLADEQAAKVRRECALAMIFWLKQSGYTKRVVESFSMVEMENLAEACTAAYEVAWSRIPADHIEVTDLKVILA